MSRSAFCLREAEVAAEDPADVGHEVDRVVPDDQGPGLAEAQLLVQPDVLEHIGHDASLTPIGDTGGRRTPQGAGRAAPPERRAGARPGSTVRRWTTAPRTRCPPGARPGPTARAGALTVPVAVVLVVEVIVAAATVHRSPAVALAYLACVVVGGLALVLLRRHPGPAVVVVGVAAVDGAPARADPPGRAAAVPARHRRGHDPRRPHLGDRVRRPARSCCRSPSSCSPTTRSTAVRALGEVILLLAAVGAGEFARVRFQQMREAAARRRGPRAAVRGGAGAACGSPASCTTCSPTRCPRSPCRPASGCTSRRPGPEAATEALETHPHDEQGRAGRGAERARPAPRRRARARAARSPTSTPSPASSPTTRRSGAPDRPARRPAAPGPSPARAARALPDRAGGADERAPARARRRGRDRARLASRRRGRRARARPPAAARAAAPIAGQRHHRDARAGGAARRRALTVARTTTGSRSCERTHPRGGAGMIRVAARRRPGAHPRRLRRPARRRARHGGRRAGRDRPGGGRRSPAATRPDVRARWTSGCPTATGSGRRARSSATPALEDCHVVVVTTFELDEYVAEAVRAGRERLPREGHRARRAAPRGAGRRGRRRAAEPRPDAAAARAGRRRPAAAPRRRAARACSPTASARCSRSSPRG